MKKIQHWIEYIALVFVIQLVRILPWRWLYPFGGGLGWLTFEVARIRREVTLDNLENAFPDWNEKTRLTVGLRTYQQMGRTSLEFMKLGTAKKDDIIARCDITGLELFNESLERGRGALFLTGHFGNWELFGSTLSYLGYPSSGIFREQKNGLTDKVINRIRRRSGAGIIPLGVAVRGVIRDLKANRFVGIVADQDAGRDGVFVNFFGRPTSTPPGPAALALKTGASIIFGYSVRKSDGRHRCVLEPFPIPNVKLSKAELEKQILQAYSTRLEALIRQYPDHWFWMHKRWKTQPPKE
ncbi:lysophospholipid acyltransferase family protein [candidate division KSB1 bacterium]|nr:lysophospholipid acyltransferase family protein [candidate division KSB1 bacterium]